MKPSPLFAATDESPKQLGTRFLLEDLVSHSPLGPLFQGVDLARDETVWIRICHAAHVPAPTLRIRALREMRILQRPLSPCLPRVIACDGLPTGEIYCAFEPPWANTQAESPPYSSLSEWLLLGSPGLADLRKVVIQIGEALLSACQVDLLHRNLAPYTVLVKPGTHEVFLLDFGFSEILEMQWRIIQGSPRFLSPEQALGQSLTEQSLVYSLSALYFFLLTGSPPIQGDDLTVVLSLINDQGTTPLSALRGGLAAAIPGLLGRGLMRDPGLRPQGLLAFLGELKAIEEDAGPPLGPEDIPEFVPTLEQTERMSFTVTSTIHVLPTQPPRPGEITIPLRITETDEEGVNLA